MRQLFKVTQQANYPKLRTKHSVEADGICVVTQPAVMTGILTLSPDQPKQRHNESREGGGTI